MTKAILMGSLIIISWFEMILFYDLIGTLFLDKIYLKKRNIVLIVCNVLVLGGLLGINREILFFSHVFLGIVILITFISTYIIIKEQPVFIVGCVLSYFSFVALVDFIFAYVSMIFLESDFREIVHYGGLSVEKITIYGCSRIVVLCCCMAIKKLEIKRIKEFQNWVLGLGIILIILVRYYQINLVSMIEGVIKLSGKNGSVSVIIALTIVFIIGLVFFKYKLIEKENEFLISREEIEQKKYKEQEMMIEKNKELIHDVKNHFFLIKKYEEAKEYEKLHDYIEDIIGEFIESNSHIYTGNRTLDFILDQKRVIAEQDGIQLILKITIIGKLPFQEREICSLFGNLIDNAIEASKKLKTEEKKIYITIEKKKQMIYIEVKNSIEEDPIKRNNRFITSKEDKNIHGYGLKSVQRIVEKYDGIIAYKISNKVFITSISFYDM